MTELDSAHHFFRHIKKSWMDGDFVDPAAFRLRETNGVLETGLSINWMEFFRANSSRDAVAELRTVLASKGRKIGGDSKFALLNVAAAKNAAATYSPIAIVHDADPDDQSHALVTGYAAYNDQVAEELAKVVMETFLARG